MHSIHASEQITQCISGISSHLYSKQIVSTIMLHAPMVVTIVQALPGVLLMVCNWWGVTGVCCELRGWAWRVKKDVMFQKQTYHINTKIRTSFCINIHVTLSELLFDSICWCTSFWNRKSGCVETYDWFTQQWRASEIHYKTAETKHTWVRISKLWF